MPHITLEYSAKVVDIDADFRINVNHQANHVR